MVKHTCTHLHTGHGKHERAHMRTDLWLDKVWVTLPATGTQRANSVTHVTLWTVCYITPRWTASRLSIAGTQAVANV